MNDGFYFDTEKDCFTSAPATTVVGDIVVLLTAKAKSLSKQETGAPVYAGDCFFDPSIGSNVYEIKTVDKESLKRIKNSIEIALKPLKISKKVKSITVIVDKNMDDKNRVDVSIDAIQSDDTLVSYNQFYEVT
ncbi:MAG: hypothetical protein WC898_02445 [Candidatus Paceibacterota bacterium]|jgi:phage gp46-like protein